MSRSSLPAGSRCGSGRFRVLWRPCCSTLLSASLLRDNRTCRGCSGNFDSQIILYREILDIFFTIHDPTTLNRQGYDVGASYRSVIFYHTPEQQIAASAAIAELDDAQIWNSPVVTEVTPLSTFFPAEDYHQQFYLKDKYQPYCQTVISPKLAKFRKEYLGKLKPVVSM